MKQLTKKQKLEFIEYYMNAPWSGFSDSSGAHICIALDNFMGGIAIDISELPNMLFPELLLFNKVKQKMMCVFEEDNNSHIEADQLRFTVISFLKAMIENP